MLNFNTSKGTEFRGWADVQLNYKFVHFMWNDQRFTEHVFTSPKTTSPQHKSHGRELVHRRNLCRIWG